MKITKFKSSLLTTTLISASLFGSKPNPGKLQLSQEGTQCVAQSTTPEDVLPPLVRSVLSVFSRDKEVQKLKEEYILQQKIYINSRVKYGQALDSKQHTNNRITVSMKLNQNNQKIALDLKNKYVNLFRKRFDNVLKVLDLEGISNICHYFLAPYVNYCFYELIGCSVSRDLLSRLQTYSIEFLKSNDSSQYAKDWKDFFIKCYDNTSGNPCVKMLQVCILDLLEIYKERTGEEKLYLLAQMRYAYSNYDKKLGEEINHMVKREKLLKKLKETNEELIEVVEKLDPELKPLYETYNALSILLDVSYGNTDELFEYYEVFFVEASKYYARFVLAVVMSETEKEYQYKLAKAYKEFLGLSDELYKKVKKEIEKKEPKNFSEKAEICKNFLKEFEEIKKKIVELGAELNQSSEVSTEYTSISDVFSKIEECSKIEKDCEYEERLEGIAKCEGEKWHEKYKQFEEKYVLMEKAKETSKPQPKTVGKGKQANPKQASLHGRKATLANQVIPIQASQKQMKQPQKPKTLEDLNAKFGKELEKAFNELEVIIIDFESEDDWNMFIEESNVEFSGVSYRHGSHESEEIHFDFEQEKDNGEIEKQRIKGQLLTYYGHGKDASEEISRQVRVTRRIQK